MYTQPEEYLDNPTVSTYVCIIMCISTCTSTFLLLERPSTHQTFMSVRALVSRLTLLAPLHSSCALQIFFSRYPAVVGVLPRSIVPRLPADPKGAALPGLAAEHPYLREAPPVARYRTPFSRFDDEFRFHLVLVVL